MNNAYLMTIDDYLKIVDMAKKKGKKVGDSMQEEFKEYLKTVKNLKKLGKVDIDIDMLAGNLREQGLKIFNMKEINYREESK